jgi:hypothetical protein
MKFHEMYGKTKPSRSPKQQAAKYGDMSEKKSGGDFMVVTRFQSDKNGKMKEKTSTWHEPIYGDIGDPDKNKTDIIHGTGMSRKVADMLRDEILSGRNTEHSEIKSNEEHKRDEVIVGDKKLDASQLLELLQERTLTVQDVVVDGRACTATLRLDENNKIHLKKSKPSNDDNPAVKRTEKPTPKPKITRTAGKKGKGLGGLK